MAQEATLMDIGTHRIGLHPLQTQLQTLRETVVALGSEHSDEWAEKKKDMCPKGYAGFVAVPRFDQFGCFRVPVSVEGWHRSSKWDLSARVRGMRDIEGHGERFSETEFSVADSTMKAFDLLHGEQGVLGDHGFERNPLRIFPVRASTKEVHACAEDEFFPDLASLAWILAAHPEWRLEDKEVLLRCVGERHNSRPDLDLVIGYYNGVRVIDFYRSSFTNVITLVGKMPS